MAPESQNNLRLEIGHVLFIDIVGYSKLLIEEQKERLGQLTDIMLATGQVARAANEELVRLPTGDGMALVFRNSSEEPAQCALEIAQALKAHPKILVRMGVHSGPVSEVTDVSGRMNIAGAGHQHGATGDGLRRCRTHPAFEEVSRGFGKLRSLATVFA